MAPKVACLKMGDLESVFPRAKSSGGEQTPEGSQHVGEADADKVGGEGEVYLDIVVMKLEERQISPEWWT